MSPKEALRGEIKRIQEKTAREEFSSQGAAAALLLRASPNWQRYKTVFLFLSIKSEIDTWPLLKAALGEGKKVFAPRVESQKLAFYRLSSLDGPWHRGPFGIREPDAGSKAAAAQDFPALILAPGLAFDREGRRLGRGGGYYDRFFAEIDGEGREYSALGLCMDFQIVSRVPAGENDKTMNGVLTGKELYSVSLLK